MRVDRASRLSIRAQIVQQLRSALESGVLGPGSPVPSSRAVASALGVSRSTVVAALQELEGEGWIESSQGSGTVVRSKK
ncbi:winged helix-turn-helix transcriptional regulator, partial [Mycobacteroides abscessus subsp. abscessus]|nr:winged helix-turn-helix transcriptional regulator [Mycobacteroides abscessus subsp. abscessus]